ncbi:hypothetical protein ACEUZ9_002936 [Paracoccus litorisediminis]|uniref:DNA-binding protein n=1 Tax=Paracoccus litorisediminis TaxID=2006130 RepID=A0A844HLF2_9RHOB|nr:hypothetical protein [Paracoccus litorisediminis]MTH60686.1 hypothetical protein [Paracoccus litorisediminis]
MSRALEPIFARETTAAKLLDMTRGEFVTLVQSGALPPPVLHDRWDVAELQAIMRGTKMRPSEEFDL